MGKNNHSDPLFFLFGEKKNKVCRVQNKLVYSVAAADK